MQKKYRVKFGKSITINGETFVFTGTELTLERAVGESLVRAGSLEEVIQKRSYFERPEKTPVIKEESNA